MNGQEAAVGGPNLFLVRSGISTPNAKCVTAPETCGRDSRDAVRTPGEATLIQTVRGQTNVKESERNMKYRLINLRIYNQISFKEVSQ